MGRELDIENARVVDRETADGDELDQDDGTEEG